MHVTLDGTPTGVPVTVLSSHAQTPAVSRRLAELGIRTGAVVRVLSRTSGGGAIVAIGDDRIAVSRTILRSVEVADPARTGAA